MLETTMEADMSDTHAQEWEKELQVLLGLIQAHPSQDMTKERDRIVVLNKLIAAQQANAAA
jgi:hypothetical protein